MGRGMGVGGDFYFSLYVLYILKTFIGTWMVLYSNK